MDSPRVPMIVHLGHWEGAIKRGLYRTLVCALARWYGGKLLCIEVLSSGLLAGFVLKDGPCQFGSRFQLSCLIYCRFAHSSMSLTLPSTTLLPSCGSRVVLENQPPQVTS